MVNQSGTCRLVRMNLMFQYIINCLLCLRRSNQQHLFIFLEFTNPAFDVGSTVINCSILNTRHKAQVSGSQFGDQFFLTVVLRTEFVIGQLFMPSSSVDMPCRMNIMPISA